MKLAIMPRPRAGDWLEDEMISFSSLGYSTLVSLITREEEYELGLLSEKSVAKANNINFFSYPIEDRSIPDSSAEYKDFISVMAKRLQTENIGIHCRMGIGRAGMTCIAVLMYLGESLDEAMEKVSKARGLSVTDHECQIEFLRKLRF